MAVIGNEKDVFASGNRIDGNAQILRSATDWGLVAFDERGEISPALAERWIVTDDGLSYIFRLREGKWADGEPIDARSAQRSLEQAIRALDGTSLGLDLSAIEEVRAMAGRVVEIRLTAPVPDFLRLLAQAELALRPKGAAMGPMTIQREGARALLAFKPPMARGLPEDEQWQDQVRPISLTAYSAAQAIAAFDAGEAELIIGGDLGSLPLVDTGMLGSGTMRIEAPPGLFGLLVREDRGLLSDPGVREGLAMAIDRAALLSRYKVGGWVPTTRLVTPGMPGDRGYVRERWDGEELDRLRNEAAQRVASWKRAAGEKRAELHLAMSEAPGFDLLFDDLAAQFATIGITLVRESDPRRAEMVLIDQVARYPSPRWFLNQFNCSIRRGMCMEDVDSLVAQAMQQKDVGQRDLLLAEAEARLTLANLFIPLGPPLRWSRARGSVAAFETNLLALHPLPPMGEIPK